MNISYDLFRSKEEKRKKETFSVHQIFLKRIIRPIDFKMSLKWKHFVLNLHKWKCWMFDLSNASWWFINCPNIYDKFKVSLMVIFLFRFFFIFHFDDFSIYFLFENHYLNRWKFVYCHKIIFLFKFRLVSDQPGLVAKALSIGVCSIFTFKSRRKTRRKNKYCEEIRANCFPFRFSISILMGRFIWQLNKFRR